MLVCGKNYRGSISHICPTCNTIDNEEHRLNQCTIFQSINFLVSDDKIPFQTVYSNDPLVLRVILERIDRVWNLKNGRGGMNDTE